MPTLPTKNNNDIFTILEELYGSQEYLGEILQAVADGITVQDTKGNIIYANPAAAAVLGFENTEQLLGTDPPEIIQKFELYDEAGGVFDPINLPGRKALQGLDCSAVIIKWVRKETGAHRWSEVKSTPIRDNTGRVIFAVNIFHDLTKHKELKDFEISLLQDHRFIKHVTDETPALIAVYNINTGKYVYVNNAIRKILGYSPEEFMEGGLDFAVSIVHPDDIADIMEKNNAALAVANASPPTSPTNEAIVSFEYRMKHKDGTWRWVQTQGSVFDRNLTGNVEHILNISTDITAKKELSKAQIDATARRTQHILESISDGFFTLDFDWKYAYVNSKASELLGFSPAEMVGKSMFDFFPDASNSPFFPSFLEAMEQKITSKYEGYLVPGKFYTSARIYPIKEGIAIYFRDISEQKKLEDNQKFVSDATGLLNSSLDYEVTLSRMAKLSVPVFADWCAVDLLQPDGEYKRVAVAHIDPDKIRFAYEFTEKYPIDPNAPQGVPEVIRTGNPEMYEVVTPEMIEQSSMDQVYLDLVRALDIHSIIIVPLKARDRIFGAMTFIWAESKKIYDQKDLSLITELARRAGVAIDNAILYKASQDEVQQRKVIELELQKNEERLKLAQNAGHIGTFEWNIQTEEIIWTPELEALYGLAPGSFGGLYQNWLTTIHPDDTLRIDQEIKFSFKTGKDLDCTFRVIWPDQSIRHLRAKAKVFKNELDTSERLIGINVDITDQKQNEEKIKYHIYHDSLTDLPNRIMFSERIAQSLAEAEKNSNALGLLLIDLDRFKNINDSLGHAIGDRLIQEVGLRLRAAIGEQNMLARLGGDEFTVLMPKIEREEEAAKLSQKILDCLRPSVNLDGHELYITPSIGISLYPYDGKDASSLLKNADSALYRAKEQGRNNYQFYTPTMNALAFEQLTLENTLRKALENKEFVLYYIPQLDAVTGEIVEIEALIRWQNPDLGLTFAEEFIHIAENTGLIEEIDEWVLKTACKQTKLWQEAGFPDLKIAVNMSARDFKRKGFVDMVTNTLEESGLAPQYLSLELTERTLVDNAETLLKKLNTLSGLGVKFVIDDFNTDFSSLNYLKQFPMVDTIKISYLFSKGIPRSQKDVAIAKSIILLGHSLNMQVVVEGIERTEQLDFFLNEKCDRLQGYLFSAAVPPQAMTSMLNARRFKFDKITKVAEIDDLLG